MGPNNLCYVTRCFLFFPYVPMSFFYKTLTSLSTVFMQGHFGFLQLLKWPYRTSFLPMWSPYSGPPILQPFILRQPLL